MAEHSSQIKSDIKKFYDQNGPIYLELTQHPFELCLRYLQKLVSYVPHANRSILELGCSAGVPCTQFFARQEGTKGIAKDMSDTQIALARRHLPRSVELIQGDIMELQFASHKFDAVSAISTIFHLPRTEQTIMLTRIYQWLKLGGLLLINFSQHEVPGVTATSFLGNKESEHYWSGWGPERIRKILLEIGFHIEIDESMMDMEHGRNGKVPTLYHWVLARKVAVADGFR